MFFRYDSLGVLWVLKKLLDLLPWQPNRIDSGCHSIDGGIPRRLARESSDGPSPESVHGTRGVLGRIPRKTAGPESTVLINKDIGYDLSLIHI